jgi:hypothetical protein
MFYLRKTYVLQVPGSLFGLENRSKTMSEREAELELTFSSFWMNLTLHFEVQNQEKTIKNYAENEQEFGDGTKAKK